MTMLNMLSLSLLNFLLVCELHRLQERNDLDLQWSFRFGDGHSRGVM
jgi:hypothetical protein